LVEALGVTEARSHVYYGNLDKSFL
jgi:hypothetical protein